MSHASDRFQDILLGIEACRPGSDDLHLEHPSHVDDALRRDQELAQLYRRVQKSDAAVAKAFHDVDIPAGLQDRLLAALDAPAGQDASQVDASQVDASQVDDSPADAAPAAPAATPAAAQPVSRRRWFVGAAVAASLLIAAGVGVRFWYQEVPPGAEEIVAAAVQMHQGLGSATWNRGDAPPAARPGSDRLHHDLTLVGWSRVAGLGDDNAVAYRFRNRHGVTGTLLVFRPGSIDPNLPLAPPQNPRHSSGVTAAAWRSDGLVYALVVDGRTEQYQSFVRANSMA